MRSNRQSEASLGKVRVPRSDEEIDALFTAWRGSIRQARKYLPAAPDYFAASLWRRLGLRINETVMLDIRDWRPDLGGFAKFHVRRLESGFGGRVGPMIGLMECAGLPTLAQEQVAVRTDKGANARLKYLAVSR